MIRKTLGIVLSILGLVGVAAFSVPDIKKATYLTQVPDLPLIVTSIGVLLVGLFIIVKSGGGRRKVVEVPIYHGKNVVGYRRH